MSPGAPQHDAPPTVLVVDDEQGLADLYQIWLSETYEVRVAYDGSSALHELDDAVDAVLLDRQMPDLTGDEVLQTIRSRELGCRVAMVTAVDPNFDIVEMGFDDYVQKPVDRDGLLDVVDGLLDRREYEDVVADYYAAIRKRALLEDRKDASALEASEEYRALEADIERLAAAVDDVTERFQDDDFDTLFAELTEPE